MTIDELKQLLLKENIFRKDGNLNSSKMKSLSRKYDFSILPGDTLAEKLYLLYKGEQKYCVVCGKPSEFSNYFRGYKKTCSASCKKELDRKNLAEKALISLKENKEEIAEKRKRTCLEKYGVENPQQNASVKEKLKKTVEDKYGVSCVFKSEEIKAKTKDTCLNKYGTERACQSQEVKDRIAQAHLKKCGSTTNLVTPEFRKTIKLQNLSKYGVPHYSQSEEYKEKYKKTCYERYGESNALKVDTFRKKALDTCIDRYGTTNVNSLEKVKERIIEYLSVLKLKGDLKSPIICLYGPPGVGKTSLCKSIAESLGRKYTRMSLGGLHDEAEIRGHRRTYIGAMPGRIIQNINKCASSNPVFVLDEIDKISADYKGDPSSALLEVLDPEQNSTFHDNFLDIDFDLSKVLFIATANDISSIDRPLLDRMELIEVNGYITEEKLEIATRHLIPKQLEIHGIKKEQVKFSKPALRAIIENYTRESGVRSLERNIAKILRKVARQIALDENFTTTIEQKDLKEYLGTTHIDHDIYDISGYTGVVTGLAWTQVGGEILYIETSLNNQKDCKLSMTGNLGNVMKESAQLAMEFIKSHTDELGITQEFLDNHSIHIHVPEGATPKDGPSAGIAILTAMTSAFTGKKVKDRLAMTGEITLRGKLLPVGGIKEKILAAKRAGIKEIILCNDNQKDIEDINPNYLTGLTFHYCKTMMEALKIALV